MAAMPKILPPAAAARAKPRQAAAQRQAEAVPDFAEQLAAATEVHTPTPAATPPRKAEKSEQKSPAAQESANGQADGTSQTPTPNPARQREGDAPEPKADVPSESGGSGNAPRPADPSDPLRASPTKLQMAATVTSGAVPGEDPAEPADAAPHGETPSTPGKTTPATPQADAEPSAAKVPPSAVPGRPETNHDQARHEPPPSTDDPRDPRSAPPETSLPELPPQASDRARAARVAARRGSSPHEPAETSGAPGPQQEAPHAAPFAAAAALQVSTGPAHGPQPGATPSDAEPPAPKLPTPALADAAVPATPARAQSADAAQDSPRVAPERPFEQIVLGLRTKLDPANQKAEIQLNPPNLGQLRVSVNLASGQLTAQFQASTDVVRDLLSSNLDRLKSVLEGQGIVVDRLAVSGPAPEVSASHTGSFGGTGHEAGRDAGHDGRSAGGFAQGFAREQHRSQGGKDFASLWQAARGEPVDLVA